MNGFTQDSNGDSSSMRLGVLIWVIGVFVVWAAVSIANRSMVDIPASVGAILAAFLTAKVTQTHIENKEKQNE